MDKQWRCKNGHGLGSIQWNGNKVAYLALYRHAIDEKAEKPEPVDVIGPLMGQMPVSCDVDGCGDVQVWRMKPEHLAEFLKTMNLDEREQVEAHLRKGRVKKTNRIMNQAKVRPVRNQ